MRLATYHAYRLHAAGFVLLLLAGVSHAATKKGDTLIVRARLAEAKDTTADVNLALDLALQALATDAQDIGYQLDVARLRAFAAQYHVYDGQVLRDQGKFSEALLEFEKAVRLDPASIVAPQEASRTRSLIHDAAAQPGVKPEDLLERPAVRKSRETEQLLSKSVTVPSLKSDTGTPLPVIKVNNQLSGEVFRAFAKAASLRILFDPEYLPRPLGLNQLLDFHGLNVAQALDYLAMVTKSFWKPLSDDTILVSNDDPAKRGAYEEQVTKAFYLTNAANAQVVADIAATIQKVTDIRKLFVHAEQNVIVARADPDRLALAEKIIADLDKPKAEIIVDVVILSVTKDWTRNLGLSLGFTGDSVNTMFAPRTSIGGATNGTRTSVPLNMLQKLTTADFNIALPAQALDALLQTTGTKLLDKAQMRTVEGHTSTLRIGQKVPYATGSFAPGSSGPGVSALVNTQFEYFDIGLNIDVLAKVHEPDEVSLHIESDTSSVLDRVDLGGVQQPEISQRKRIADVRVKEGEVNVYDIVTERQDSKSGRGVPGLSQIPGIGRLFTSETVEKSETQVLTLLIPHIIRAPDIRQVNLAGVPSGTDQVVRMRYTPDSRLPADAPVPAEVDLPPGPPPPPVGAPVAAPFPGAPGTAQPGLAGAAAPSVHPKLRFVPPTVNAAPNGTVTVSLVLNDAPDMKGGTVSLIYDNTALKVMSIQPGPLLAPGGAKSDTVPIELKLGAVAGGGRAVSGQVATFTFQAIAPGPTAVVILAYELTDAQGRAVPGVSENLTVEIK